MTKLDQTIGVLGDATRREIVMMLARRPHGATEIFGHFNMTQPGVSRHLRILRESGLVDVRTDPSDRRAREYELRPESLKTLQNWLAEVTAFWQAQLDSFAEYVEREDRRPRRRQRRRA